VKAITGGIIQTEMIAMNAYTEFSTPLRIVSAMAGIALLLALAGNLYPQPEETYGKLHFVYLAYLTAGRPRFLSSGRKDPRPVR